MERSVEPPTYPERVGRNIRTVIGCWPWETDTELVAVESGQIRSYTAFGIRPYKKPQGTIHGATKRDRDFGAPGMALKEVRDYLGNGGETYILALQE
jgi:hypothetical protein